MASQTLNSIWNFFQIWERYHPEYTEEERTEFLRELVKNSDDPECKRMIEMLKITKTKEVKTETDLLQEYADEMGIGNLTLKELIKSHKHLREQNVTRQKAISEGYQFGYGQGIMKGRDYALKHNWISRGELKSIRLMDLMERLGEE